MDTEEVLPGGVGTLREIVSYRPELLSGIVLLNFLVAITEGVGLGLLIPVIEQVQSPGAVDRTGVSGSVADVFALFGLPFTLETTIVAIGLVMTVRFAFDFLSNWLKVTYQTRYVEDLKQSTFVSSVDATVGFHDRHGSDEVLDIVLTKVDYADSVIESLIDLIEQVLTATVYVAIALYLAPVLAVGMFLASLVVIYVLRRLMEASSTLGERIAEADIAIYRAALGGIQGIRDVKLYGLRDRTLREFRAALAEYADASITMERNRAAMEGAYQLVGVVALLSVIYFAVTVARLPLSTFGVFLFVVYRLVPQLNALNGILYELGGNLPHLKRAFAAIDELERNQEPTDAETDLPETVDRVEFDDVSFAYEDEQVLNGVTFGVDRGEETAFVGASGAGKSTVMSLLTRMYDPDGGEIRADGVPIEAVDVDDWRQRVSVVRQSPYIFDRDLRFNVTLGREVSERELDRVCEITQVSEFIDRLPRGYDTMLGENGVRLSGGQRQRVAMARALLRESDLLVFDEATSEMDAVLERRVFERVRAMGRQQITIVIAHRLSTVTDADTIYTMADGRIVEVGSHDELVDRDGTYARLYASQS